MVSNENYILHANFKFIELFGYNLKEIIEDEAILLKDIISQKTFSDVSKNIRNIDKNFTWSGLVNGKDKSGKSIKLSLKIIPIFFDNKQHRPNFYLGLYDLLVD